MSRRLFATLLAAAAATAGTACHAQPTTSAGPASCAEVADHVRSLLPPDDDHARKVRDVLAERCRADRWPVAVTSCMMDERDLHAGHHCQDQLSAEQRTAFARAVAAIDAPPEPPPEPSPTGGLPRECADYEDAVDQLVACDKLPEPTRNAVRDGFAQTIRQLSSTPPDQRANVASSCKMAAAAIRQALAGLCAP